MPAPPAETADAVVVGGGIAGACAAAALAQSGWSVMMIDPGEHAERRLAGELIHPPGVAALRALGLLDATVEGVAIDGFAVATDAAQPMTRLCYPGNAEPRRALVLEQARLRSHVSRMLARMPEVRRREGVRLTGLDLSQSDPVVTLAQRSGRREEVRARLVVAADGGGSLTRRLAGIPSRRYRISTIAAYTVPRASLPEPALGDLFLGASPVLGYGISADLARILFDLPLLRAPPAAEVLAERAASLPAPLCDALRAAMASGRPLGSQCAEVVVEHVVRRRVVLVGDAGGTCHPLTATGITVCARDALRLGDALRESGGAVDAASAIYTNRRRGQERARRVLARALYDVLSRSEPERLVIRRGLVRYWQRDERARTASMAVLSLQDSRIGSVLGEMARVILAGLGERSAERGRLARARLTVGVAWLAAQYAVGALRTG